MSQVFKSFMGVFFILILLLLGVGVISAQIDVSNALDYKSDIVVELENSNYNSNVINGCIQQAAENGYDLQIKTYAAGGASVVYTSPNASDTTDVVMAEVTLTYPYTIGFLNAVTEHTVRGYAR